MDSTLVQIPNCMSSEFVPHLERFRHQSTLHGQAHVARVMVHALRLLDATRQPHEGTRLWAAVFLHDLARTHDGVDQEHGADAMERFRNEPDLRERLKLGGVTSADLPAIEKAVTLHCQPADCEPPRHHDYWMLVALLKDADALDRVRLGDLDTSFLHFKVSVAMVPFAQALFDRSQHLQTGPDYFDQLLEVAEKILEPPKPKPQPTPKAPAAKLTPTLKKPPKA